MINTKRPSTDDYTQVGFVEAKDTQGNYRNIDHIYDTQGNIVFQQGYLNEYQGADNFGIPAIGKPLLDYTIYGNTVQNGTPTSDNPIMPQGTGERTGNLAYGRIDTANVFSNGAIVRAGGYDVAIGRVESGIVYTVNSYVLAFYTDEPTTDSVSYDGSRIVATIGRPTAFTAPITGYVAFRLNSGEQAMLNAGSTALPYEPYGIKIPISSANTTTPAYLGEVQTTRKIKKLVFNGSEPWVISGNIVYINNTDTMNLSPLICTHFPNVQNTGIWNGNNWIFQVDISNLGMSGRDAWIAYLQQQYAAGTPVTVWYVLATPETGIVNEPLMKIGDYADTLSMEQAGVSIPTLNKPNTTVIDVETEVEPSEVDVTYRGSTKPKYDLFLAQNGDSFEAKDGQSLYIGGDL